MNPEFGNLSMYTMYEEDLGCRPEEERKTTREKLEGLLQAVVDTYENVKDIRKIVSIDKEWRPGRKK